MVWGYYKYIIIIIIIYSYRGWACLANFLNVAKWQSGDVARAEPNMFELCRALATSAKPLWHCGESTKQHIWLGGTVRLRGGNVLFPCFNRFSHATGLVIWIRTRNVVPLQSIREMLCECGPRLSIARASSALRSPCTAIALVNQMLQRRKTHNQFYH